MTRRTNIAIAEHAQTLDRMGIKMFRFQGIYSYSLPYTGDIN